MRRNTERHNRFGDAGFDWSDAAFVGVVVAFGIAVVSLVPHSRNMEAFVSQKDIANLTACEKAGVIRVLKYRQMPLTYSRLSSIKSECNDESNRAKVKAQMRAAQPQK